MKKNQGLIVEYACLDHAVIILVKSSKIGMLPVVLYGTWYFLTDAIWGNDSTVYDTITLSDSSL